MDIVKKLAQERRARLAAERLLQQKQTELFAANKKLGAHARALSDDLVDKQAEVQQVRSEAQALAGENTRVKKNLAVAEFQVQVAERRLWNSIQTVEDGFAVFDQDSKLVLANNAYIAAFDGLEEMCEGITYPDVLRLLTDEGIIDLEGRGPADWREDMLDRWQSSTLEPMVVKLWNGMYIKAIDRRGSEGDTVCLALDITDTIRYEARLDRERLKAESANRAKSAFLANMTHELRTPMNGVVGMAELLGDTGLSEEQMLYRDTIHNSATALLSIINDVLDFSKIEAERLVLRPDPFDIAGSVQEITTLLLPSTAEKSLSFYLYIDPNLPGTYHGDSGRFRQVLTNLIGNAIKFCPSGHVMVSAKSIDEELVFDIADTGIGIEKSMCNHIFGEFNQVEDERNRQFEGTGLGLAITKKLIEQMGGSISVESIVGEGSCFTFRLPNRRTEGSTPPKEVTQHTIETVIVDPDEIGSEIISNYLIRFGVTPTSVQSINDLSATHSCALAFVSDACDLSAVRERLGHAHIVEITTKTRAGKIGVSHPMSLTDIDHVLTNFVPPTPVEKPTEDAIDSDLRKLRVVAAEDNKTNQLVLRKMLKTLDIDLTVVNNGQEAVQAFRDLNPDLMFMDISMPIVDGKEATRQIREIETADNLTRTPIVALTAHSMEGDKDAILAAGLDHYLTKPLRKAAIHDKIRALTPDGVSPPFTEDAA